MAVFLLTGLSAGLLGREADIQTMSICVETRQRKKRDRYHQGLCGFKDRLNSEDNVGMLKQTDKTSSNCVAQMLEMQQGCSCIL